MSGAREGHHHHHDHDLPGRPPPIAAAPPPPPAPLLEAVNLSRSVRAVSTSAAAGAGASDRPASGSAANRPDSGGGGVPSPVPPPSSGGGDPSQHNHPPQTHVLWRNISFTLDPGDVLFVSGPSGVGKTLLLRALALLDPLEGEGEGAAAPPSHLLLRGRSAAALGGPPSWRSRVTYVHQGRVDFPGTPRELLREARAFCAQRARRSKSGGGGGGGGGGDNANKSSTNIVTRALSALFPFLFPLSAPDVRPDLLAAGAGAGGAATSNDTETGLLGGTADDDDHHHSKDDDDTGDPETAEQRAQALLSHIARRLGLNPRTTLAQPWAQLSGGQAQRAALAVALALRPQVLLLDEPTSACDAASARRVERVLRDAALGRLGGQGAAEGQRQNARYRQGRHHHHRHRHPPLPAWLAELERGLPAPAPPAALVWVTHDEAQALRVGGRVLELPSGETGVLPSNKRRGGGGGAGLAAGGSDNDDDDGGEDDSEDGEDWEALFGGGASNGQQQPRVGSAGLLAVSSRASLTAEAAAGRGQGGTGSGGGGGGGGAKAR